MERNCATLKVLNLSVSKTGWVTSCCIFVPEKLQGCCDMFALLLKANMYAVKSEKRQNLLHGYVSLKIFAQALKGSS